MPASSKILADLRAADLMAGIWLVPAEHGLPTFHCHVIEGENHRELAPLPGEGFGCDFTHDRALAKALLEAAQARVTAISGTREDITRSSYPDRYERDRLADWRGNLASPRRTLALPRRRRRARLRRGGARPAAPSAPESRRESCRWWCRFSAGATPTWRSSASSPRRSVPAPGPDRMADDIVVFLGPTLRHAEAATLLDARYLPPAEQGSFVRAVRSIGRRRSS